MKRGLYPLIVNRKYYARFLRTKNLKDAIRAVQHPKDAGQNYSQEEQEKAVKVCENHRQGKLAFKEWEKKKTAYTRNMAFAVLTREAQNIPPELLRAVLEDMEKQIASYEKKHPLTNDFDEYVRQYSILESVIKRHTGKQVEVFKKYALQWKLPKAGGKEAYLILKERYTIWKRRKDEKEKKWTEKEELLKKIK